MRLVRRRSRAAVAGVALVLAGCGSSDPGVAGSADGPLDWRDPPVLSVADNLPDDRILAGTVRNVSIRKELRLDSGSVVVRDAAGQKLQAYALYSFTYAHGLYGKSEVPGGPVASDRRRLGYTVTLRPGQASPLVVAYRLTPATKLPVTVDYGEGELPVPETLGKARE